MHAFGMFEAHYVPRATRLLAIQHRVEEALEHAPELGPILSYNVPQQVSYSGQNYLEIDLDESYFLAQSVVAPQGQGS